MRAGKTYNGRNKADPDNYVRPVAAKDQMVSSVPKPTKHKRIRYHYDGGDGSMMHYKGGVN